MLRSADTNPEPNAISMHTEKPNGADKSATHAPLPTPASETVRRTRGSASRSESGNPAVTKASGHANGSANHAAAADSLTKTRQAGSRVNGHGHAFSCESVEATAPRSLEAGSDDVSGPSVATALASAEPGADRDACAALARANTPNLKKKRHSSCALLCSEEQPRVPSEIVNGGNLASESSNESAGQSRKYSPGEEPLPADPAEFVEEIHSRIDLFQIWAELLKSNDEKIKQRAVEKLTEMRYKGAQSLSEEPQQILIDVVRPRRDL
jgi:hypothetical protein